MFVLLILTLSLKSNAQLDKLLPSANPPGGLSVNQVPQFITFGFDDNGYSGLSGSGGTGGMSFLGDLSRSLKNPAGCGNSSTFDGSNVRFAFYAAGVYAATWGSESNTYVKKGLHTLLADGHEIGNHTYSHPDGTSYTASQWQNEIQKCIDVLIKPFDPAEPNTSPSPSNGIGMLRNQFYGFRTPFLAYSNTLFNQLKSMSFTYDCSIEEGFEEAHDGTNFLWPYTLDNGSPGHDIQVEWGTRQPLAGVAGLWEMPVYCFIIPPDNKCTQYGITPGLRKRMFAVASWFDSTSGKLTGLDYNAFVQFKLNKAEFLGTLKYNLDLRLAGNRSPFNIGAHSDVYSSKYTAAPNADLAARQAVIQEFIQYALTKPEVRIVTPIDVINWMKNPVPLSCNVNGPFTLTVTQPAHGIITLNPQKTQYNKGDIVTVSISTEQGYQLSSWIGAASGSSNSVQVTMNTDKTVSAIVNVIQGQCPSKIDLLNTGTWAGLQDGKSTIANTFTVAGGVITCPYTVAKMSAPEAYDTWVSLDGELADGTMRGLSSISITYQSDQPLIISLPQPILDATGESFQVSVPSSVTLTTLDITIDQFAKPDWTAPEHANIPLKLDSIVSISIQPDVDVSAAAVSGTIKVSKLDLCGIIPVGIKQHLFNDSELNIYGISNGNLTIYSSKSDKYTISVYTVDGKLIYNKESNLSEGINSINMNTSLNNSIYLIKVMNNHTVSYKKVSVVN